MDCAKVSQEIEQWIVEKTKGFDGVVIGLSGGIDSALSATLAVRAIGNQRVFGLMLPNILHNDNITSIDTVDAIHLAEHNLFIKYKVIDIHSIVNDTISSILFARDGSLNIPIGNICARTRMMILYGYANSMNRLVLGTTNKTELEIGYYTKYGDGAVDIEPIADLYKREVFELSKYVLGIPDYLINKQPSAGLWAGQTDEGEIGCMYKEIDEYLMSGKTNNKSVSDIIDRLRIKTEHKRSMPPFCKLSDKNL